MTGTATETSSTAAAAARTPRASIVIPVRNGEALLRRALHSATAQTEGDIEVVVVDDGSTDGTWGCVEAAATQDPRIRGIRLPANLGAPAASNVGFEAARGGWVAILDHDDWYDPRRLERLLGFAERGGFDVVADNQQHWDEKAGAVFRTAIPPGAAGGALTLRALLENAQTGRPRFDYGMLKPVLRREFVRRSGLKYLRDCPEGYDFHLLLDCFALGAAVGLLEEPLYFYAAPYGEVSRHFSRPDKLRQKLVNYDRMRLHAERAADAYTGLLSVADLALLRQRARSIAAYSAYLEARAKMAEGRPLAAAAGLVRASDAWPFAARGAARALGRRLPRRQRAAVRGAAG